MIAIEQCSLNTDFGLFLGYGTTSLFTIDFNVSKYESQIFLLLWENFSTKNELSEEKSRKLRPLGKILCVFLILSRYLNRLIDDHDLMQVFVMLYSSIRFELR